jgi:hypothetical protein
MFLFLIYFYDVDIFKFFNEPVEKKILEPPLHMRVPFKQWQLRTSSGDFNRGHGFTDFQEHFLLTLYLF